MASHQNGGGNFNAPPSTGNPPLTLAQLQAQAYQQACQQMYYTQPASFNQPNYGFPPTGTPAPYGYPMPNYNMMYNYPPQPYGTASNSGLGLSSQPMSYSTPNLPNYPPQPQPGYDGSNAMAAALNTIANPYPSPVLMKQQSFTVGNTSPSTTPSGAPRPYNLLGQASTPNLSLGMQSGGIPQQPPQQTPQPLSKLLQNQQQQTIPPKAATTSTQTTGPAPTRVQSYHQNFGPSYGSQEDYAAMAALSALSSFPTAPQTAPIPQPQPPPVAKAAPKLAPLTQPLPSPNGPPPYQDLKTPQQTHSQTQLSYIPPQQVPQQVPQPLPQQLPPYASQSHQAQTQPQQPSQKPGPPQLSQPLLQQAQQHPQFYQTQSTQTSQLSQQSQSQQSPLAKQSQLPPTPSHPLPPTPAKLQLPQPPALPPKQPQLIPARLLPKQPPEPELQKVEEKKKEMELELARKKMEEEIHRKAEEDRRILEESLRKKKEAEEAKRRADEEKRRRQSVLELEEMKQQIANRILREEEEKRKKLEYERNRQEEEMKKAAEQFQQQLQQRLKEEEERLRKELEDKLRQEQEREKQRWEYEWKKKAEDEARRIEEEEQRRRLKQEELLKAHEELLAQEREERRRWEMELEEKRKQEEAARKKREHLERKLRRQARKEAKKKSAEEQQKAKQRDEEEKVKLAAQMKAMEAQLEATRIKKEQEAKKQYETMARQTQILNAEKMQSEMERLREEQKNNQRIKEEEEKLKRQLEEQFRQEELALQQQYLEQKRRLEEEAKRNLDISQYVIPSKEIEILECLGKGSFGEVFRGRYQGRDVAVKKLLFTQVDDSALGDFKQEIALMSNLKHPNVLRLVGACTEPGHYAIVTELMARGSLEDLIFTKKVEIPLRLRLRMLKDAALGMHWLHSLKPPFVHRDFKTGNLLVDEQWNVKISDFGLSSIKTLDEDGNKIIGAVGSPYYMAPEVLVDKEYDEKADVYAFAVTVWEVLTQDEPYKDEFQTFEELVEAITIDNQRPKMPSWFSPSLRAFLENSWSDIPERRPPFEYILREKKLDSIAIELLLKDALGVDFWKTHFIEHWDSVPWTDFCAGFKDYFERPIDSNTFYSKCFKLVGCSNIGGKEVILIEDFVKALYWFGGLDADTTFLTKMAMLCSQSWFFGEITTAEAESILKTKKSGAWLIRFGEYKLESPTREYILSVVYKHGLISHHKLTQNPNTGKITYKGMTEYSTLEEFIKSSKKPLKLKSCCTGSKFEPLTRQLKPSKEKQDLF
eukprot:TRINITY_DN1622_c0_g2_i2.p1 TRINITY_DN1622_c0_g2~~TRINITY_DN1622_c0_g2_i2.p1  ORF type:complete len:1266 (-),score=432.26 TRINITY_DN1622_c0_g2_i2:37-3834(-)